jgi:hypothetical protein
MLALVVAAAALQYPLGLAAAAQLLELSTGLGPPRRSAVRAAYRRKAAISHPDVSTAPNAQRYFLHITAAYETLLQYSVADTTQSSMKSPSTVSVSTSPSSAAAAEPDKAVAHSAPSWSAQAGSCRPERFEKQVAAWRLYWQASFQTLQCSAEAERKALQVSALAHEREVLRANLAAFPSEGRNRATLDGMRALYAQASAKHADAECHLASLRARVRMLEEEAARLQVNAEGSVPQGYGI